MSAVTVRDVFKSYAGAPVLERVNLEVADGDFCAIVGASGCGKSTFLRMLLAQELPTRGRIHIGEARPAREPGPDRGVVFQRYSVFPHLSVRDNLILPVSFRDAPILGRLFGSALRKAEAEATATLERVGLAHVADAWPSQLSGGMQQRLAIAQALVRRPRVLLLDEPFGALDPGTRLSMHDFLLDLWRESGMTIFMVSHDLSEAFKLGTRVVVFDKPRWDPQDPSRYGATITHDFRLGDKKGETSNDQTHEPDRETAAAAIRDADAARPGGNPTAPSS
ncbi:MAG: lauroyl acyltransferase [Minwuia thermotolerans]|nr:MAG: lauroyl acyltransferase [Minwuia thermotolerans]